jgi:hypothetical protein
MIDKKTIKLMEVCVKLHYAINPHLILREGSMRHLILEQSELESALKISQEKLTAAKTAATESMNILKALAQKASQAKEKYEINPGSSATEAYFNELNSQFDKFAATLTELSAMSDELDNPKNYKKMKNVTTSALELQNSLQNTVNTVKSYIESVAKKLEGAGEAEATLASMLAKKSKEAVPKAKDNIASKFRSAFKGKQEGVISSFLSKMAGKAKSLVNLPNAESMADELAQVVMLVPVKELQAAVTGLSPKADELKTASEDQAKAVAEAEKTAESEGIAKDGASEEGSDSGDEKASGEKIKLPDSIDKDKKSDIKQKLNAVMKDAGLPEMFEEGRTYSAARFKRLAGLE